MKRILLAADGSTCAEEAAWLLARLGHDEKYELTIVTALEGRHRYRNYAGRAWLNMLTGYELAHAVNVHRKIEEMFQGADVEMSSIIRVGNAAQVITTLASEQKADLVVIGAKGHTAIARIVLGSTSDRVATHAPCSVLVVRPTGLRERKSPIRIAACFDREAPAEHALDQVARIGWGSDADFRVVNVCSHLEQAVDGSVRVQNVKAATRAAKRIRDRFPSAHADVVENDHIGDGLVRYLNDEKCDLAVVGETRRGRIERAMIGSISRFVLRHAECSVWIDREKRVNAVDAGFDQEQASSDRTERVS